MLKEAAARRLADELDIDALPACPACLFELAWPMSQGGVVRPALVARTADWVWLEIEDALEELVIDAREREIPGADAALQDLALQGCDSALVRVIVVRLAGRMANEIVERAR